MIGIKVSLCNKNGDVLHFASEYLLNNVDSQVSLSDNLVAGCERSQILYSIIFLHLSMVSLSVGI